MNKSPDQEEVNKTVPHEWMTCRARADCWREELDLLQEEMHQVIAFLEWKLSSWGDKAQSRLDSVTADVQNGIDAYAHKQESMYHELAVSLANQWLPCLLTWGLDVSWAGTYPWAAEIICPPKSSGAQKVPSSSDPAGVEMPSPNMNQVGIIKPVDLHGNSGDDSDKGDFPGADSGGGIHDEGENSDGLTIGFDYDDKYMS